MRVLKWNVPVDDQPHEIGTGTVVLVACQSSDVSTVQVWTQEYGDSSPVPARTVRVFGTGHDVPAPYDVQHIGSTIAGPYVWHVFEEVPF